MKHGSNPRRGRSRGNGKRPSNKNQTFESNGPDVKVRGSAQQVLEKYLSLARDASSSGDRITAESYLQFAEHYYRILSANQNAQAGDNKPAPRQTPADQDITDQPELSEPQDVGQAAQPEQPEPAAAQAEDKPAPKKRTRSGGRSGGNKSAKAENTEGDAQPEAASA